MDESRRGCGFVYVILMWLIWHSPVLSAALHVEFVGGQTHLEPRLTSLSCQSPLKLVHLHNGLIICSNSAEDAFTAGLWLLLSYDSIAACDFKTSLCVSSHGCPGGHQNSIQHATLFRFPNAVITSDFIMEQLLQVVFEVCFYWHDLKKHITQQLLLSENKHNFYINIIKPSCLHTAQDVKTVQSNVSGADGVSC